MPAVFVHGNPETSAIWEPLFDALQREDLIALSPPGFGAPVVPGWTATRREYVDWLDTQLESIEGPIDLVGHDWGGGHVLGSLIRQPNRVRSWCVDVVAILHPDFHWHDAALEWQTPERGEAKVARWLATPRAEMAAAYEAVGMTADVALSVAEGTDERMGDCILGLYRDAAQPRMAELGQNASALSGLPGLAINAEHDDFVGSDAQFDAMAIRTGATVAHLANVGHWWMCEDPDRAAAALEDFWSELDK